MRYLDLARRGTTTPLRKPREGERSERSEQSPLDLAAIPTDVLNARLHAIYDSDDPHSPAAREERHLICQEIYRRRNTAAVQS